MHYDKVMAQSVSITFLMWCCPPASGKDSCRNTDHSFICLHALSVCFVFFTFPFLVKQTPSSRPT